MTHVRNRVQDATDPPRNRPLCVEQRTAEMKSICLYSSFLGCTNSAPHQNVCDQHVGIVKIPAEQNRFSNFGELKNCKSSTFIIFDQNRKVPVRIFSKVLQDTYILVFSSPEDASLLDKYDRCTIPELVEKHQELPTSLFWQVPKELFPQGVQFVYKGHPKKIFPIRLRIGTGGVRVDQLQKVELADGELGMMMSVTIDVRSGLPTQQMKLLLQIGANYYEVLAARRASAPAEVFDFAIPLRHLRQLARENNTVPVQLIRPLLSNKLEAKVDRDDQAHQPIGLQQRPQQVNGAMQAPDERRRASHSPSPAPSHGSVGSALSTPLANIDAASAMSEGAQRMVAHLNNEIYRLKRELQAEKDKRHIAERDLAHERKQFTNFREELMRVQQQQQQSIDLLNFQQQQIMSPIGTTPLPSAAAVAALGTMPQQPSVASSTPNIPLKLEGGAGGTAAALQAQQAAIKAALINAGTVGGQQQSSAVAAVAAAAPSQGSGPGPGGSGGGTAALFASSLHTDLPPIIAPSDLHQLHSLGSSGELGNLSPRTLSRQHFGLGDSEKDLKGGSQSSLFGMGGMSGMGSSHSLSIGGMGSSNSLLTGYDDDTAMRDVGQLPLLSQSSLSNLKQLTPPTSFSGLGQS